LHNIFFVRKNFFFFFILPTAAVSFDLLCVVSSHRILDFFAIFFEMKAPI